MIAGIDLGGTQARVAIARSDGRITATRKVHTADLRGPEELVAWAAHTLDQLRGANRVTSIAIGSPGPIDQERGVLVNPPNLKGWRNVPLESMLSKATGARVHLENDANLAGLGEFHQGAGQGSRNMVYITWSTGVGAGVIVEGKLYSGSHGTAGELGHTIIDPDGPVCTCGQRGCLEQLAAGHGIASQAGKPALEVFADAARGEARARMIVTKAAVYMGLGLINVTNLLDPDVIVIGGGIVQSWSLVQGVLRETLASSPFIKPARRPKLRRARLGDRAGLTGAVEWARAKH